MSSVSSKNGSDTVLKHKISLAAVSSGSEVGDTGRDMGTLIRQEVTDQRVRLRMLSLFGVILSLVLDHT